MLLAAGTAAALAVGQGDEDLDENEFDRMLRKLGDFEKKTGDGAGPKTEGLEDDEDEEDG